MRSPRGSPEPDPNRPPIPEAEELRKEWVKERALELIKAKRQLAHITASDYYTRHATKPTAALRKHRQEQIEKTAKKVAFLEETLSGYDIPEVDDLMPEKQKVVYQKFSRKSLSRSVAREETPEEVPDVQMQRKP